MTCNHNVTPIRIICRLPVLVSALFLCGVVSAADAPQVCTGPEFRAFDFWAGRWAVHVADGSLAGHNEIRVEEQGCLLTELWQGVQGSTGQSFNVYDPEEATWRQFWVSPGVIIDIRGGLEASALWYGESAGDSMVLVGTITYFEPQRRAAFRGVWTPLPDGRVRQYFEEQRLNEADELVWQPWFEGFYSRSEPEAVNTALGTVAD